MIIKLKSFTFSEGVILNKSFLLESCGTKHRDHNLISFVVFAVESESKWEHDKYAGKDNYEAETREQGRSNEPREKKQMTNQSM